jgi:hypothetical protein
MKTPVLLAVTLAALMGCSHAPEHYADSIRSITASSSDNASVVSVRGDHWTIESDGLTANLTKWKTGDHLDILAPEPHSDKSACGLKYAVYNLDSFDVVHGDRLFDWACANPK